MNRYLAILLFFVVTCTRAQTWEPLDVSSLRSRPNDLWGATVKLWIDTNSIVRNGETVSYWQRFSADKGSEESGWIHMHNITANCKDRTIKLNKAVYETSGKPVQWEPFFEYMRGMTAIPPGSLFEVAFTKLCSRKFYELWKS